MVKTDTGTCTAKGKGQGALISIEPYGECDAFWLCDRLATDITQRMKNADVRWIQRFQNFKKAFRQLSDAAALGRQRALSELEQQGFIQAFEFTHELAWNTLKDFLESRGAANVFGSKDATRQGFAAGLIENGEVWMEMIQSRNKSTDTYDITTAEAIVNSITSSYLAEFEKFQKRFGELEREEA